MFNKNHLLTPGPTPIPPTVLAALSQPIIHHRTPAFEKLFADVRGQLKELFGTRQEVISLACSGTGAMEAAVCNLFSPGERVLTLAAGKFGERWTKIARAHRLEPIEIAAGAPGETIAAARVAEALAANPGVRGVLFQASETSTGVKLPTREIAQAARAAGALSVCDAITACGVFELPMDEWGIDCLITGSQKALMLPPGLALIALSDRAWAAQAQSKGSRFYFDLAAEKAAHVKNQTAWTPAISLIAGLHESLKLLLAEGLPQVYARHRLLAAATRAAVAALGLEPLSRSPSEAVTAVRVPATVKDGKGIPKLLREKYGVVIAGGQDELEGKIFRLSHFGHCDRMDIVIGVSALELALAELGHPVEFGRGVGAVLREYSK